MTWLPAILIVALGPAPSPADPSGPRVVVDQERHSFGKTDVGVAGRHQFVFTNTGNEPLLLTRGTSTCGCCTCVCAARLPESAIPPGRSAKVTLEWKSKLYVGPFRQTATIVTNDPNRREVALLVTGRFAGPVGVAPSQLVFGSLGADRAATAEARLFSYLDEPLEITGCELSNPQNAKYFDVSWEPLSAEQVREEGEARGGYSLRITVRPGLPVGGFRQRIVLKTNSNTVPTVEIPVQGLVVSDVSIVGRGWSSRAGVLTMGTINSREGTTWPLMIVVRGAHAKDVKLQPIRTVPDLLEVELGPARYIADKSISVTRLTIRIPPGSRPATHLKPEEGKAGQITLRTNHPKVPELTMQVRFAVKE